MNKDWQDGISKPTTIEVKTGHEMSKEQLDNQEGLSDYKKRSKMGTLSGDEKLREELIELKMKSMNNKEDFIEVLIKYINSIK